MDQLRLGIIASGIGFILRPANVFCAKAKRQWQQHEVGHSVVATGRGVLRLSSFFSADSFDRKSVATVQMFGHPLKEVKQKEDNDVSISILLSLCSTA